MEQERQERRGFLSRGIDAINSARLARTLFTAVRATGTATSLLPLWLPIVVVIFILLSTFLIVGFTPAPGAAFPPGTTTGPPPIVGSTGANPPPSASLVNPPPVSGGHCGVGSGDCSIENLRGYFGENAQIASIICQRESGSNPSALNSACLRGGTADYSAGLFQINILAHCPGAFNYTLNPPSCQVINDNRRSECLERFRDPETNIREAVRISGGGTSWSAWGAARACGIINR